MNTTNIRSFVPIQKLGEGSFASVYKVTRVQDQQIYALKKIKMNRLHQKAKENSLNQVRFLASFHSPFITKYYQAFFDQQLDVLCIVMQYAQGGDLRKMIQKHKKQKKLISQIEIWKVIIHLIFGLKTLHDNKILHRDIKCQNILISDGKYKIGDMNVSKVNKMGFVDTQTGTPYYSSPQVWKDQPYNQKSDIWSFGCILYELATLRPPFTGKSMEQLYKSVLKGVYSPIPICYSDELRSIINKCLQVSPLQRMSTEQLMSNPTFKIYQNICIQPRFLSEQANVQMLQTICLPTNMKELNKCLPKPKYNSSQSKGIVADNEQCINIIETFQIRQKPNDQVQPPLEISPAESSQKVIIQSKPPEKQIDIKAPMLNVSNQQKPVINQGLNHIVKSYSKKQYQTSKRRVLNQLVKKIDQKPRTRSKSLPRTERKSMSLSKQIQSHQQQQKQNKLISLNSNQMRNLKNENKGKNRYWNILQQAKKYLQRSVNKSKRIC